MLLWFCPAAPDSLSDIPRTIVPATPDMSSGGFGQYVRKLR